ILASVHFDRVIFEGGFVGEIGSNPRAEAFLEHTLQLCSSLGSTCSLGYGIEHEVQAEFFKKIGCRRAQGNLFYRPFELERFKKLCMKENVLAHCCRSA
ncbi:MAG: EAL domain-containing protein, partial [Desulfovibrionaceae bacterium]|nr:EAL domain-containing protein [Desulfovibrionaceae bacterium]